MRFYLIQHHVDLYRYPTLIDAERVDSGQVTIGDLHANAVKLLYVLIHHGFVSLDKTEYLKFVDIYLKPMNALSKKDIGDFKCLLTSLKFQSHKQKPLLRLIGDVVSDRGSNDFFTLSLIEKLIENHIQVEILLSNHDAELIHHYEHHFPFGISSMPYEQSCSAANMQYGIDHHLFTREEINRLIDTYYECLKIISYTKSSGKIFIFSHAPIRLYHIECLALKMKVQCENLDDLNALPEIIDKMNAQFRKWKTVHKISDLIQIDYHHDVNHIDAKRFPFYYLIWSRALLPKNPYPDALAWVHGHDQTNKTDVSMNHYNLDNYLGKGSCLNHGEYIALLMR